ncbi:MAG: aminotransferase class I/II-fold pyridoxal phosphate-dependent enzyme [Myxococcales bacterium]|nr:aminotransferase class I/II-fold pyridoxal phosphate-dependent enzyme [Myxococcales bacterium]
MIDLRSDTVTRPTDAMRRAMASAEVGDDVYGEDPTVRRLEEEVAALLGKEAALFVPSGTMANQLALALHAQRGEEILVGENAHVLLYESGAAAGTSGVQLTPMPGGGLFDAYTLAPRIRPPAFYYAKQAAVAVENTHNHAGGRVFPQADLVELADLAKLRGLGVHLDGARLWNASVATGLSVATLAAPADTVSVCFSKGLGAPIGSAVAFPASRRDEALRLRRRMGGAMRQAGLLAAAALYALEHHRDDLHADHRRARRLAEGLAEAGFGCDPALVETNIVPFDVDRPAEAFLAEARELGVWLGAIGPERIRAVTHRDLDDDALDAALRALATLARE